MSTHVPKLGAILTAACIVFGLLLFFVLNSSFGGPTPVSSLLSDEPYTLDARFDDAEGLLTKSLVLVRGVQVGEVESVGVEGDRAAVTVLIDERYAPLPRGTTARLGNRTVFGEKYVDLAVPPGKPLPAEDGEPLASGTELRSLPNVPLDEALDALDDERREDLVETLDEVARGTRSPAATKQLSATYAELPRATESLRALTDELSGQEDELAGLVDGGSVALGALGEREDALRRITSSARVTLEAVASRRESLGLALAELAPTLEVTRGALESSRPLLTEARPLVADLAAAAPELRALSGEVGPVATDLRDVVTGLPGLRRAAVPALDDALPALRALLPVAKKLEPATANLVPVGRYLEPHKEGATSFFTNLGASTLSGDGVGRWLRFFVVPEESIAGGEDPGTDCSAGGAPASGFCNNAYPEPGDAADNRPFAGTYPRLMPFDAPPRPGRR